MQSGVSLKDTNLLCVDPSSGKTFSINLGTQACEAVDLSESNRIDNKIARDRFKVDYLLDRQEYEQKWEWTTPIVDNYRRMMVPFYLMEEECNPYPVYTDNSTLTVGFSYSHQLKSIKIILGESVFIELKRQEKNQANRMEKVANAAFKKTNTKDQRQINASISSTRAQQQTVVATIGTKSDFHNDSPINSNVQKEIVIEKFSLLATADSLIKLVERRLKAMSNFAFENSKRIQLLKFDGIDSFLYGDTQMIYFNDIREHLSSKVKTLTLVLQSFGEEEVTPTMYERHMAELRGRGISSRQAQQFNIEFPPIVIKNQNQNFFFTKNENSRQTKSTQKASESNHRRNDSSEQKKVTITSSAEPRNRKSTITKYTGNKQYTRSSFSQLRGFQSRLNSSSLAGSFAPLSQDQQIAACYQKVQLFLWYQPQVLASTQSGNAVYNGLITCDKSCPFELETQSVISTTNKLRGCDNFLSYRSPMVPLHTNDTSDILPSCLLPQAYEFELIGLRNLTVAIEKRFNEQNGQPIFLPKVKYTAPYEHQNYGVQKLLSDCLRTAKLVQRNKMQTKVGQQTQHLNPLGNLAFNHSYTNVFQEIEFKVTTKSKESPFFIKPKYVQLQAALYLGCKRLSVFSYSQLMPYQTQIDCTQVKNMQFWKKQDHIQILQRQLEVTEEMILKEVKGDLITIKSLPNCTRLCINVLLLPEWCPQVQNSWVAQSKPNVATPVFREGLVLGSCSMTLFDEKFLLRQGPKELRLWPFEAFSARMVCQTECMRLTTDEPHVTQEITRVINMQIKLPEYQSRVGWRLDEEALTDKRYNVIYQSEQPKAEELIRRKTQAKQASHIDRKPQKMAVQASQTDQKPQKNYISNAAPFTGYTAINSDESSVDLETKNLMQVKKLLDAYPMEISEQAAKEINLENVLSNTEFIQKLPIYIKLVDFTNPVQAMTCYKMLESSQLAKDMKPDEALVLLDGQFSDIKVRLFAVQKLSQLNDDKIALIMPQLVQALKYELFHHSPLAEFLLERALKNLRVVGHAFYWALKANLWCEQSLERLFLILERFLMCCGGFKNDLVRQNLVNESLKKLSAFVNNKLDNEKCSKKLTVALMHDELAKHALRIKMTQQLLIAHSKFDDCTIQLQHIDDQSHGVNNHDDTHHDMTQLSYQHIDQRGSSDRRHSLLLQRRTIISRVSSKTDPISKTTITAPQTYRFDINQIHDFVEQQLQFLMQADKASNCTDLPIFQNIEVFISQELLYTPFAPKNPLKSFASKGGTIFLSKKKPLLIVAELADQQSEEAPANQSPSKDKPAQALRIEEEISSPTKKIIEEESPSRKKAEEPEDGDQHNDSDGEEQHIRVEQKKQLKFLFKCGDDLRQDNLTLQFFKIMDGLWQKNHMRMEMICYSVMESGFETGYIEFIDNATVITDMHVDEGNWQGPFKKTSVMNFFLKKVAVKPEFTMARNKEVIENRLQKYHWTFLKSLAGQSVATYVLGIRDRHPGNYMMHNSTGKFFHIDFGHFLGHAKMKVGFQRDREPFIYSDELNHFLTNFGELMVEDVKSDAKAQISPTIVTEPSDLAQSKRSYHQKGAIFSYRIYQFDKKQAEAQSKRLGIPLKDNRQIQQPRYSGNKIEEYFENLAVEAFIMLRRNADIFVNLLILMLVADLEELDIKSIEFIKKAMFLNVSEEEAAVNFRNVIMEARKQWYRPIDNLFHIISDRRKNAKRAAAEKKAMKQQKEENQKH